ncbi:MAG: 50S ribosomal protein L10 [Deltaproteobacteria bacterium]|nr:50S ribosomal protein L10 [Deltaproteobacteria bacterium]
MLTRREKQNLVNSLTEWFRNSGSVILLDFAGMNVSEVSGLRHSLKGFNCKVKVARNKLIQLGFRNAFADGGVEAGEIEKFISKLKGSSMTIFSFGDPVKPIKEIFSLRQQLKDKIAIKAVFLDKQAFLDSQAEGLKDLPSREECIGMLLSLINAPIQKLLLTIKEPSRRIVTVIDQYQKKVA